MRNDKGALWENFIISERLKFLNNTGRKVNSYFWRTYQNQEIDYIEEYAGKLFAYEFKWNPKAKVKFPKLFSDAYPESIFNAINSENYSEFIL